MNDDNNSAEFNTGKLPLQHRFVTAEGIRFHVVESGSGPPVVLVAGFPQSCYAWRKVMPILSARHRVLAVDLPGQGDSSKPLDGYDTRTVAQKLHGLICSLCSEKCFFVGHDIGAWVGYPYAAQFPEKLWGLVLLDGNIPGITLSSEIALGPADWRSWHFLFNRIPDLPEALLRDRERVLIEWFFQNKSLHAAATFSSTDIDEYVRVYQGLGGLRGMLGYYRAVLEDMKQNRQFARHKLKPPVLALGADQGSAPNLYEAMQPLALEVRGGQIAECGHYIAEEQPQKLADEMLAFFDSLLRC